MIDTNSWIFILIHDGKKQQQTMKFFLSKGIAFESASECLSGADSRD